MQNNNIPKWIEETLFQCDSTEQLCSYKELNIVWYGKIDRKNPIRVKFHDNFMLVKQGKGFERIKNDVDGWTLSDQSLEQVLKDNLILFFTDFLVVDSTVSKGDFEKKTNLKSWTELFRRLSIPNYEAERLSIISL